MIVILDTCRYSAKEGGRSDAARPKQQCRLFLENIKGRNLKNVEELLLTGVSSTGEHRQCCCTDLALILPQPLDGSLAGETETDKEFKPKFGRRSKVRFQEEMVGETQM